MSLFRKFGSSYFTHLVLSYSILAVVLVAAIGGYLFSQANALMLNELTKESRSRLAVAQDLLEKNVLPRYVEGMRSKYFNGILPDYKDSIYRMLDAGWEEHMVDIVNLSRQISYVQGANEGISNLSVFIYEGDFSFDRYYFYPGISESPDHQLLTDIRSLPKNKWFMRTDPRKTKVLTYLVTLPFGFPEEKAKGYMFLDVDVNYLTQLFTQVMNSPYEQLYLFDSEQQPVLNTGIYNKQDSESVLRVLNDSSDNDAIKVEQASKSDQIVASLKSGTIESFQYGIIRPFDSFALSSKQFQKRIVVSCLLILILGLLFAYLLSRRFYFPMKSILTMIKGLNPNDHHKSGAPDNEYKIINRTIRSLDEKIVNLESKVKNSQLSDLLKDNLFELSQINRIPTECQYVAVDMELMAMNSDALCKAMGSKDRDQNVKIRYDLTPLNKSKVAMIFYLNMDIEKPEEVIREQLEHFRAVFKLEFAASIGPAVRTIEEIPTSYREATKNLRYIYLYGRQTIVSYSEISRKGSEPIVIALDPLKHAIRAGSVDESVKVLQELETLCLANVKIEVVELSQMQLLTALSEIVIELNLHHIVSTSDLFRAKEAQTFTEMIAWIRGVVVQMAEYNGIGKTKGHSDLVNRIKSYIDERLHEDLSLNVLSELVSLSPSYISTIFADVLHVPFTEYVTTARLEKAAELLKSERSSSVADIAIRVGYRNSQYFCTKFKMKFGITPVQYRNSW